MSTNLVREISAADVADVSATLKSAVSWLMDAQTPEGFWVGMVQTNSAIEAEWLLCGHILGVTLPNEDGIIRELLHRQRPDGSWDIYSGAPAGDVNSTVEVYAALRARGVSPTQPEMARAKDWIIAQDAMNRLRVFSKYWLALIGVWPWEATPNLPPEVIRFPLWFPFSLYNFAQWARATIVPLAVICARRPVFPLTDGSQLEELFTAGIANFDFFAKSKQPKRFTVDWVFTKIDAVLHSAQTKLKIPGRETAIKLCLEWMIKHQDSDGAWGGIQPPWIYGVIALRNEGYALNHPVLAKGISALSEHWSFERDGRTTIQATESPVWDTLFSLFSLHESGVAVGSSEKMRRALEWVLDREVRHKGDWAMTVKNVEPSGWCFERANTWYPDVDDTALALIVLKKLGPESGSLRERAAQAAKRGLAWTLAMQSDNGGWGAFDKNNTKSIVCKIPFCNFGEALDPPSVDVTGHVLEALGLFGMTTTDPAIRRALDFLKAEQEDDGSWFGRWGVNHIYGTGAVLPALQAIGEDMAQPYIRRAVDWLVSKQNEDGGWGEVCGSYMDIFARGAGASTASQTAWALMGLIAADDAATSDIVARGAQYLAKTQTEQGTWREDAYTGTGFPGYGVGVKVDLRDAASLKKLGQGTELSRGFMINYNLYRHYFPVIALSRATKFLAAAGG